MQITIYTDGSCLGNPGPGGWAAILMADGKERVLQDGARSTTNNQMELTAAIEGLEALTRPCEVVVYSDSTYVVRGATEWVHNWKRNNWQRGKGKPLRNRDLWQRLDAAQSNHKVVWKWVRGHAGDEYNEMADRIANAQAHRFR